MALAVLIAVYVNEEYSYDHWMEDSDHTYRVYRNWGGEGTVWTPPPLAGKLNTDYPQVQSAAGFVPAGEQLIEYNQKSFYVEETSLVDSTFFQVVGMALLQGDPKTVLDNPENVVPVSYTHLTLPTKRIV